jgi:3-methylcrotonyl-CoA carboxylase alpha subunit
MSSPKEPWLRGWKPDPAMPRLDKVLIANRGEIACRIIASCRRLGLKSVAVYSEADAQLTHALEADEAYPVGGPRPQDSYLRVDRLLKVAAASRADAVHPGYGFLSENAAFAEAAQAAGLTWIGPAPESIRTMGDKQRARELAIVAGVPVVPGSRRFAAGELGSLEEAAASVGFPLLIKAAAGGGGIGMRRVDHPEQLQELVAATQSMASMAFGDGAIFLERFIPKARHVEIQVFGYGNGQAIHLFERDCSLQRRFQKVIEESPAPGLPKAVRDCMAIDAVNLCRATKYRGAGTVEFIVDAGSFAYYFLEMNTRIQVEHPVTEMVTGNDLVAMQIELARGNLQAIDQASIRPKGHAIEARLYAENPAKKFMPSPGQLSRFRPPEGDKIRVDTGYREGDTITPFYDPLVAKVIAWGDGRAQARAILASALRAFELKGIRNNRDFLIACLGDDRFAAGDVSTSFIDQRLEYLLPPATT